MGTAMWKLLIVVCAMVAAGAGGGVIRAQAPVSLCGPGMVDVNGVTQCYAASRVLHAEHSMRRPVISPRGVVWRLTHLRLRQVSVESALGGRVLLYLFGEIPGGPHG